MTIRNLDALFEPKAIALVGASNEPLSVGAVLAANLFEAGYAGPIVTVNPHERAIRSSLNYRSVAELPVVPDLAVVATPAGSVPGLIADLSARGCRAAVVVSAGFGEGGIREGELLRQRMLEAARPHLLRVVGPNCLGFISPLRGINASFAQLTPRPGDIALLTQSGAIATALLDWATANGIGFSHVVSLGDMADVDFGDLLDYFALDPNTRAIVMYVEGITHARKFMSAGRIAARTKPVVVIKAGRGTAGSKAAISHTGALAGSDIVYDAAFRRAGMLRVIELRDLFDAVRTVSRGLAAHGDRLAVLTNGGGAGVIAADTLEDEGGRLAEISAETIAALDEVLPAKWSRANPVDILGDATGARYTAALEALLREPGKDAVLVINCPTAVADSREAASQVAGLSEASRVPVLACWLGTSSLAASRDIFAEKQVPAYETPEEAVKGFMQLVRYHRNQGLLLETPPAADTDLDAATIRAVFDRMRADGRSILTEPEAKAVLTACRIPVVATRTATDPDDAVQVADSIGYPVALKILSPDITHKSDVGGVRLAIDSGVAMKTAAQEMLAAIGKATPDARIEGFMVQRMVKTGESYELLAGISSDATFGPVVLVGAGGTATEVVRDRAVGLPPLNAALAGDMIDRTRISRMLHGYRDRAPADRAAVTATLVRLSRLAVEFPEIAELDINPLLADDKGVVALDARIVLRGPDVVSPGPAIMPYPAELESQAELGGGLEVSLRPIRPEDASLLGDMLRKSDPEDVRFRFLGSLKEFPGQLAARLSQIDYAREMALVAVLEAGSPEPAIAGVARLVSDPENETAEFAIMVRSDLHNRGLGSLLMEHLITYARRVGLRLIHGDVLASNAAMLELADALGFRREASGESALVRVTLDLSAHTAA